MFEQPYRKIHAWAAADEFVVAIYKETRFFPKEEAYGITSQLRRAATSVVANIVEGNARNSTADFLRFLFISKGSLGESAYFLELAFKLEYLQQDQYNTLMYKHGRVGYLLHEFIKFHQKHLQKLSSLSSL